MGMYDEIHVEIELPGLGLDPDRTFQTKSLACFLDHFRIDPEGVLWHEDYDIEDRSRPGSFAGSMTRVNKRWVKENYTGEVRFYDWDEDMNTFLEYSAYFEHGIMVRGPHRIHDT